MRSPRICIIPKLEGHGGPASFQRRLIPLLTQLGCEIHHDIDDPQSDAILVNGGTRNLLGLWRAKRRGVRIVQRLAQMNWVHRQRFSGFGYTYRSIRNNLLLGFIRRYFADDLIYQSEFVQSVWESRFGVVKAHAHIIYNGVNTDLFTPAAAPHVEERPVRIAVIEGHLGEGNEVFLINAVSFGHALAEAMQTAVEMYIAGDVPDALRKKWHAQTDRFSTHWLGVVDRAAIIDLNRSSHFLFSAELNGGCPNAVIEALSCGTPVIGYATGALPELIHGGAGLAVPYGGNHWRLEKPDVHSLVRAAQTLLIHLESYQKQAREKARAQFAIERIAQQYQAVLIPEESTPLA